MGEITLSFVDQYAEELFPDAAIVFFANRPPEKRPSNSTGLIAALDLRGSAEVRPTRALRVPGRRDL